PRHEDALAGDVGALVERVIEQPEPDVAHPDFVRVGKGQGPFHAYRGQVLADGIELATRVSRRLLRGEDEAVEDGQLHARSGVGGAPGRVKRGPPSSATVSRCAGPASR